MQESESVDTTFMSSTHTLPGLQPSALNWEPHPYQLKAVKHLLERGGAGLFLDPGLGKTAITLASLLTLKSLGRGGKALVVAPLRPAQLVWRQEARKWVDFHGLKLVLLHGADKNDRLREKADIYILNYDGLQWFSQANGFERLNCDTLVLDESTKVKNARSERFKNLRGNLNLFKRRWILTGTPVPNGLIDLWSQIYVLDGGLALGRFVTHFRTRYFHPSGYGGYYWELNNGAEEEIYEAIKPYALRMGAEDYLEMPELVPLRIEVELPPEARRKYNEMYNLFISEFEAQMVTAANAAVAGGKCRQIANGAIYREDGDYTTIHDAKLDALDDLVEELSGSPALVVYEFNHDKKRILDRFKSQAKALGPEVNATQTAKNIEEFNSGRLRLLVVHPASAGHGLNLQGSAAHIIFYGITWNLEYYDQVIARVWRQGNPHKRVFVHHIVAKDTLDERVLRVLVAKDHTQQSLLAALVPDK